MTSAPRPTPRRHFVPVAILAASAALAGCGSLDSQRTTETSGKFRSTGFAFTIFSIDLPKGSLQIARENASDANLPNMEVTATTTFPYFGPFDWILDIISFRFSAVEGTWGYDPRP